MERLTRWAPLALDILRIVAALLFIEHGTQKLFGWPPGENPPIGFAVDLMTLAGVLEAFGGLLLLLGLFTRPLMVIQLSSLSETTSPVSCQPSTGGSTSPFSLR